MSDKAGRRLTINGSNKPKPANDDLNELQESNELQHKSYELQHKSSELQHMTNVDTPGNNDGTIPTSLWIVLFVIFLIQIDILLRIANMNKIFKDGSGQSEEDEIGWWSIVDVPKYVYTQMEELFIKMKDLARSYGTPAPKPAPGIQTIDPRVGGTGGRVEGEEGEEGHRKHEYTQFSRNHNPRYIDQGGATGDRS